MLACDLLLPNLFSILLMLDIMVGILEGVGTADCTDDGERMAATFSRERSSVGVVAADLVLVIRRGVSTARRFVDRTGEAVSGGGFRVKGAALICS
jgi:hypothetical protein